MWTDKKGERVGKLDASRSRNCNDLKNTGKNLGMS
jgi:hypothetical protein